MQVGLEKADLRIEVSVQEHKRLKKQLAAQRASLDASGGKLWHQICQCVSCHLGPQACLLALKPWDIWTGAGPSRDKECRQQ